MTMQRDVAGILHELEHKRIDPWGTHAKHLADGIERSGVPALLGQVSDRMSGVESAVRSSSSEITASVAALAAVNAAGFVAVCGELGRQTEMLNQIESLLASPLSTAAAERYRRGVRALHEGWYDDALTEFNASIDQDPFQALSHYCRGLALGALDRPPDAIPSFMSAIKYCGSDPALAPVAAGAALLAAQTAESSGHPEAAQSAIAAGLDRAPDCAELLLAKARQTGDQACLKTALSLAPELALPAVAVGVRGADDVAGQVHDDPAGPIAAARSASRAATELGTPLEWPTAVPDAMTFHHQWRLRHASHLEQLAASTRREADQADNRAQQARHAVKSFSMPAAKAPYAIPLIVLIICVFFFFNMFFSFYSDAKSAEANGIPYESNTELNFTNAAGGLAFPIGVGAIFFLWPAIGEARRNSRTRAFALNRLHGLEADAAAADSDLKKARARANIADAMLQALDQACPRRTLPLSAPM